MKFCGAVKALGTKLGQTRTRHNMKIISMEYFYESVGKWVKDCPFGFKTLKEDYPCVGKYLEVANFSWQITFTKEICLHLSLCLYDFMKQCSFYVGSNLSQAAEKLLDFIKMFLVDGSCFEGTLCQIDKGFRDVLRSLINASRKWSILTKEYSHAWSYFKDLAQRNTSGDVTGAVIKVQNVCKGASENTFSQIDALTNEFVEKTQKVITGMSDLLNNSKISQASMIVSSKLIDLLGHILELFDSFFEYVSSLTAFDFDIPFEMGWEQIEEDEFGLLVNAIGLADVRMKRRFVGQH